MASISAIAFRRSDAISAATPVPDATRLAYSLPSFMRSSKDTTFGGTNGGIADGSGDVDGGEGLGLGITYAYKNMNHDNDANTKIPQVTSTK